MSHGGVEAVGDVGRPQDVLELAGDPLLELGNLEFSIPGGDLKNFVVKCTCAR